MTPTLIFSGIVDDDNIHDVFFHICAALEGKRYSVKKKTVKSSSPILSRTDQEVLDSIIKKKGSTTEISIGSGSDQVTIIQLLNPLNPKKDPNCPYAKISTNQILIENQNRRGVKERIVITINP